MKTKKTKPAAPAANETPANLPVAVGAAEAVASQKARPPLSRRELLEATALAIRDQRLAAWRAADQARDAAMEQYRSALRDRVNKLLRQGKLSMGDKVGYWTPTAELHEKHVEVQLYLREEALGEHLAPLRELQAAVADAFRKVRELPSHRIESIRAELRNTSSARVLAVVADPAVAAALASAGEALLARVKTPNTSAVDV